MQRLRRRLWRQDASCVKSGLPGEACRPRHIEDLPDWPTEPNLLARMDFNIESMEEELTCPVCLELYADPLMLPCSHSICKKCLQDIMDNKFKGKKVKKDMVLNCPSCRKEVHLNKEKLEGLPRNLVLENVVIKYSEEKYRTIRKSLSIDGTTADALFGCLSKSSLDLGFPPSDNSVNCDLCEEGVMTLALWHCIQCEVSYCNPCFTQYHPRRGALARHRIRSAEDSDGQEKEDTCSEHESEIASLFCDRCKTLVCHLCLCEGEGQHAGHVVLAPETASKKIKDAFDQTKQDSDGLLATMIEQKGKIEALSVEIHEIHKEAIDRVEKQFQRFQSDMINALELERIATMQKLYNFKQAFNQQTQLFKLENDTLIGHLEDLSVKCHDATDDKKAKEILSRANEVKSLASSLEAYQKESESVSLKYNASIKDKSVKTSLQNGATEFGNNVLHMFGCMFNNPPEASVPHIMSPVPGGNNDLTPRVQNKCLTTWGFTSTTFTAEELTESASWTVTVEKNMSQVGSLHGGYLFGIGISPQPLEVKSQAGVSPDTYALLCSMGKIQYGEQGRTQHEIMTLDTLPMSITMTVNMDHQDFIIMTYRMETCAEGQVSSLVFKKLLRRSQFVSIYPVFTVSQRVKMLFPTCV